MKKNNVKIKDNIGLVEEIMAVREIEHAMFIDGSYTPYYRDMTTIVAISKYFIDGITFEDNDNIYNAVCNDNEIFALIQKFYKAPTSKNAVDYKSILDRVNDFVDDCVEFEKQKIIHGKYELQSIAKLCDMIVDVIGIMPETINFGKEFIQKMENKEISEETLTNVMKSIISEHKMPETEIYEEQRKRIAEQQSLLEEKENEIVELRKWKKEHNNK